jgi:hypothetical protein
MPLEMNLRRDLHRLPLSQDADSNAITDPIAYEEKIAPLVIPNAIPPWIPSVSLLSPTRIGGFTMRIGGKTRLVIVLLAAALLVHSVRETRPKAFSTELLTFREGTSGTMASGAVWLLDKTGNITVKEFKDHGFYTSARISILGNEQEVIGLPITGKFYRFGDSKKSSSN